jgi:tRNA-splicing ligase RtcB
MHVIAEEGAHPIRLWTHDVEPEALRQLRNTARLPFLHPHGVAAMPDVHYGIGATVGSVLATDRAIVPAAVGVDIGCGMNAVRTSLRAADLPDSLASLRRRIERNVPLGAGGAHATPVASRGELRGL